ncbi:hypothetical protein L596_001039 [Steinernema carpocapsae]|uniref:Uncharacterized protein n=1 Tax=Steinernema carpocapsae TaxID=34508 RepID=A0A4U8UJU4_STECR|nr:hypothetical protein L596_001039 [Steinernema carpocapsae]
MARLVVDNTSLFQSAIYHKPISVCNVVLVANCPLRFAGCPLNLSDIRDLPEVLTVICVPTYTSFTRAPSTSPSKAPQSESPRRVNAFLDVYGPEEPCLSDLEEDCAICGADDHHQALCKQQERITAVRRRRLSSKTTRTRVDVRYSLLYC